jgi:hypothetical protein
MLYAFNVWIKIEENEWMCLSYTKKSTYEQNRTIKLLKNNMFL